MRLYLRLSPPKEPIPFNHANILTGFLHKALGPNEEHDGLSLYSFGWLRGPRKRIVDFRGEKCLLFPDGVDWFISSPDGDFLQRSISGIFKDPNIRWGSSVRSVEMAMPPVFPTVASEQLFELASPVFYKKQLDDGSERHFLFSDPETDGLLTANLQHKLARGGLDPSGAAVRFDRSYPRAQTKLIRYEQKYAYRCSLCPVILTGTGAQLAFAHDVGIGQSTGTGFGALV